MNVAPSARFSCAFGSAGSRHHEGCDQRGGEQSDDTPECCWWSAPTGEQRAEGLEGEAAQTEHGDEDPDHRRAPIRAAAAARTIGTPAGRTGVVARVMAAANAATTQLGGFRRARAATC